MSVRVEVLEDGTIQVEKYHRVKQCNVQTQHRTIEHALVMVKYWVRKEIELSEKNRFVSMATVEARRAFKKLSERSPFSGKKTQTERSSRHGKPAH